MRKFWCWLFGHKGILVSGYQIACTRCGELIFPIYHTFTLTNEKAEKD